MPEVLDKSINSNRTKELFLVDWHGKLSGLRLTFLRTWRRVAICLFSVLLAILQIEIISRIVVIVANPPDFGCPTADKKYRIACAVKPDNSPTLVFLGASYSEVAIQADLLRRNLADAGYPVEVLNLAVRSSWPKDQLFFLKKLIANGTTPKIVFYDVLPMGLNVNPYSARQYSPQIQQAYKNYEVAETGNTYASLDALLRKHFYAFRYRSYFKQLLTEIPTKLLEPDAARGLVNEKRDCTDVTPHGWVGCGTFPADSFVKKSQAERLKNIVDWTLPTPPDKKHLRYLALEELTSFCKEKHIALVFVWLPQQMDAEEMWKKTMNLTTKECSAAFSTMADNKNTWFLDLHDVCDTSEFTSKSEFAASPYFCDYDHVNVLGALKTTSELSEKLCQPPLVNLLKIATNKVGG